MLIGQICHFPVAFLPTTLKNISLFSKLNYYHLKAVGLWAKIASPNEFSEAAHFTPWLNTAAIRNASC